MRFLSISPRTSGSRPCGTFLFAVILTMALSLADSSVFFPFQSKDGGGQNPMLQRQKRQTKQLRRQRQSRNAARLMAKTRYSKTSSSLTLSPTTMHGTPPMAFSPTGWAMFGAATVGYIGNMLRSEAIRRALYFWIHAGPIVAHYKFTRWHLSKTRAPLEKRDRVYNALHNKYCHKSLAIALTLKGAQFQES
jgi:hypothetical protein